MSPEEDDHVGRMMKDILLRVQTNTQARLLSIQRRRACEFGRLRREISGLTTREVNLLKEAIRLIKGRKLLLAREGRILSKHALEQTMQKEVDLLQEFYDMMERLPDGDSKIRSRYDLKQLAARAEAHRLRPKRDADPAFPDDIGLHIQLAEIQAENGHVECQLEENERSEIRQTISATERCVERVERRIKN